MNRFLQGTHLPIQYFFAFVGGLLLGLASIWMSSLWVLFGLAAIFFLLATINRPEIGLLAILGMTSTILFEEGVPLVPIGIGSLNVADILLLGMLTLLIIRSIAEPQFKFNRTPLDLPLLIFVGMTVLSTFIAMGNSSVSITEALRGIRTITYYLTFFLVTNLVRREGQILLLIDGVILFATIVAAAMIAQFLLGTSFTLFPGRVETLVTQGRVFSGVTRVLPPGQSLVMFGFIILWVSLAIDSSKVRSIVRFLQAGLISLAVILTFNRSFYVMAAFALVILAWLLRAEERKRLVLWSTLAGISGTIILVFAIIASVPQIEGLVQGTIARFSTLTSVDTVQEGSLKFRYIENAYALPQIATHPIIGLGLRAPYRPVDLRLDYYSYDQLFTLNNYIHNGHFEILLTSGWIGYLALISLTIVFIVRCFKNWRMIPNIRMRAILLACVITAVGVPVANLVDPIYMQDFWIPLLGIILGIGENILLSSASTSSTILKDIE